MRFKNYINRFNKSNRIYSDKDILKMSLENIFDDEDSIMSQNTDIGIPSYEELNQSPNTTWIEPYVNEKGKTEGGYWQSIFPQNQHNFENPLVQNSSQSSALYNNNIEQLLNKTIPLMSSLEGHVEKQDIYNDAFPQTEMAKQLNDNDSNEPAPILEGRIEYTPSNIDKLLYMLEDLNIIDEEFRKKYEGLSIMEAMQKAASKSSIDTIEREYYGLSSKLKDQEMIDGKVMEENDIYSLKDIKDSGLLKKYQEYLAKMNNLDPNDPTTYDKLQDTQIVVPKETSRLYSYTKNSEPLQKWIAENYDRIKNGEKPLKNSIEFPSTSLIDEQGRGLFATIHNSNIEGSIGKNGGIISELKDFYDFDKMKYTNILEAKTADDLWKKLKYNAFAYINNNAYKQQQKGQLERYPINMSVHYTKEEVEEILKKMGMLK